MTATVRGVSIDGRGGTVSQDGRVEYRATYKVYTDDRRDGPQVAGSAFGIPALGAQFTVGNDFDPRAVVVGKTVSQGDSPFEWTVEVTWSNDVGQIDPAIIAADPARTPLDDPPEITFGFQTRRVIIPGRFNDPLGPPSSKAWEQGIFAPNGELFDPQPEVEMAEPVLKLVSKEVNDFERLLEGEEMFRLPRARQRFRDLIFRGLANRMTQLREFERITLARHDGAQNLLARLTHDVTEH